MSLFIIISLALAISTTNINPFVFAKETKSDDKEANNAHTHINNALKAAHKGDAKTAEMHTKEAIKVTSDALKHLKEAKKALHKGDTKAGEMHLKEAKKDL